MNEFELGVELKYAIIYQFTNKVNGKMYIGQTLNSPARIGKHLRNSHCNELKDDINKLGLSAFTFSVLEFIPIVDDIKSILDQKEVYYINLLLKADSDLEYFEKYSYNVCKTPTTKGFSHSEESKNKMSVSHLGRKLSQEHSDNIGKAVKKQIQEGTRPPFVVFDRDDEAYRKKLSIGVRRAVSHPIAKYTLSGIFIKAYDTQGEACPDLGLKINKGYNINKALKGVIHQAYGFQWKYIHNGVIPSFIKSIEDRVRVLDREKNEIGIFESPAAAATHLKIHRNRVYFALNDSKHGYAAGFYFFRLDKAI